MSYDFRPAVVAAFSTVAAEPLVRDLPLPGPTRDEWAGVVFGVLALAVRELVWWLKNRRS